MSRNALMLAFHFPPFAQSSGSIRTLSFVRRLPDHRLASGRADCAQPMLIQKLMNAVWRWSRHPCASFVPAAWMLRVTGDRRTLSDVARNARPLEYVGCGGIRCRARLHSTR